MDDILEALSQHLTPRAIRIGTDVPHKHRADAGGLPPIMPEAVVYPETPRQVSDILLACRRLGRKVVVQGGMTGLAGGAHPQPGEIALSLERMSGIEEIDEVSRTMTVLAGTKLETVQKAAEAAGLYYGVDLGARGSCTIGGNVATNAGGIQVLRYGMTRRSVLGLEAVLADGRIVSSMNKMMKNNAGFDWTQLFIGSEGTVGVITKVVLALQNRPLGMVSALCGVRDASAALSVLRRIEDRLPGRLMAFEAMWREYMDVAVRLQAMSLPFETQPELTLLVECALSEGVEEQDAFAELLAELLEEGLLSEAVLAHSGQMRDRFWAYREANYEFGRVLPPGTHFDVSIPPARMDWSIAEWRTRVAQRWPQAVFIAFGHLADGNLHLSVYTDDFGSDHGPVQEIVYGVVGEAGGSISAEHGIGVLKRPYLHRSRSDAEIAFMKLIKDAVDPTHTLNPGRVF